MKLIHFLQERIEQTLYLDAVNALDDLLREKGADWVTQIKRMTGWDEYQEAERAAYDDDNGDLAAKLRDRWYDRFYDFLNEAERSESGVYHGLMESFKNALEARLQGVARDYIESKLGKIQPYVHQNDYDEEKKKNLYWMQHIVVDYGMDDTNEHGDVQSSGGHYQKLGSPTKYKTAYAQQNVNSQTDLMVAIKLYGSRELTWRMIKQKISDSVQEDIFGEAMSEHDSASEFAKKVFPTFVHEVVHLEQDGRENNPKFDADGNYDAKRSWHRRIGGITYTPDPARGRQIAQDASGTHKGSPSRNKQAGYYQKIRWGKRGAPSHLQNKDYSEAEFIEYLGSAHEIEAHAAGAAAKLISDVVAENRSGWRRRDDERAKQRSINDAVDYLIGDMKSGYFYSGSSLKSYANYMKSMVDEQLANLPDDKLPKVNILYRKAWTIFMKKLVKHILAFKKPLPPSPWGDDDEPKKTRPGALPKPEKEPILP